jgi:hypothetical protein
VFLKGIYQSQTEYLLSPIAGTGGGLTAIVNEAHVALAAVNVDGSSLAAFACFHAALVLTLEPAELISPL